MRYSGVSAGLILLAAGAGGLAGCVMFPRVSPDPVQPAAAVETVGEAKWTATTWEAASTPAHRHVLEEAHPKTITGEVIDVSCFLQLGERGEAHIPCGQKCVRNGQPIGILTDSGRLYLVVPEEHHPSRDCHVSLKERFADLMRTRVRVSGMVTEYQETRTIFVRTLPNEQ